jgi:hypothetical protein
MPLFTYSVFSQPKWYSSLTPFNPLIAGVEYIDQSIKFKNRLKPHTLGTSILLFSFPNVTNIGGYYNVDHIHELQIVSQYIEGYLKQQSPQVYDKLCRYLLDNEEKRGSRLRALLVLRLSSLKLTHS